MDEQVILYILYAFAGGIAGLIRFLESKKRFNWRVISTSVLVSALSTLIVIGWWFDTEVVEHPTRCLAFSLAIGYLQPNITLIIGLILKAKGISLEDKT